MDKEQSIAIKTLLYTTLTILLGYALFAIPVINFIAECLVVFIVFNYLYDMYSIIIRENKTSKKKGKK